MLVSLLLVVFGLYCFDWPLKGACVRVYVCVCVCMLLLRVTFMHLTVITALLYNQYCLSVVNMWTWRCEDMLQFTNVLFAHYIIV